MMMSIANTSMGSTLIKQKLTLNIYKNENTINYANVITNVDTWPNKKNVRKNSSH